MIAGATVLLPEENNGLKLVFWRERLRFIVLRDCLPACLLYGGVLDQVET